VKRAARGKPIEVKRLDGPDEERRFEKGLFRLVSVGGAEIGRAEYQPGWRWSVHVGPTAGTASCEVEHVGLVISGRAAVKMDDGEERVLGPGDVFHVPPGHDSWVVGDEPYVSLHLQGAAAYAAPHAPPRRVVARKKTRPARPRSARRR
jgi:quercetin dioxygenase-like cupin family protein